MSYNSKYTGAEVEALLDIVSQGGSGGGEVQKTTEAEITAMGFTKNLGTITEVKMNGASKGTSGVVDLGTVITEHQDISGKQDKITDLETIRSGAEKGATALQSVPSEYVTDTELMWTQVDGEAGVRLKGTNGTATGNFAISAGDDKTASDGTPFASAASGDHAVAFGYGNTCAGRTTLAQGLYNIVNGKDAVAFGQRNLVNGDQAFAAGQQNEVTARIGLAIGYKNKATNTDSIAIGYQNTSSGSASVAMGDTCEAIGTSSTAMGYKTKATGSYTSTFGQNTQATNAGEVAMGLYNKSTTSTDASEQTLFSFGIGTSDTNRTNAFEIKKNGDVYIGDKMLSNVATTGSYNDLTDKPTIPSEQANNVYVTDFTVTELNGLLANPTEEIPLHIDYLREAIVNHKVVLVPYSHSDEYQGYGIASGYIDDFLYVTICLNKGRYIDLELDYTYDGIYGHQVREREVPTTDSVITKSWASEELGVADAQGLNDGNIIYALPSSANGDEDDILVSERTLKTINGQSLIGSGDIEISGGSGGGSGKEYVEAPISEEPIGTIIDFSAPNMLEPNKVYVATSNEVQYLSIQENAVLTTSSLCDEYTIMFKAGGDGGASLSLLEDWIMANELPELTGYVEVNIVRTTYQGNNVFKVVVCNFKPVE